MTKLIKYKEHIFNPEYIIKLGDLYKPVMDEKYGCEFPERIPGVTIYLLNGFKIEIEDATQEEVYEYLNPATNANYGMKVKPGTFIRVPKV